MTQKYYPNVVVQQSLLKSLDPDNKNIIVTKQNSYGDGINVWEIEKYIVKNVQNKVVFEYTTERLDSSFRKTLKIQDIVVSYDTHNVCFNLGPVRDFDRFIDTLENALKQKLSAQEYNKAYEKDKKNMSLSDSIIMKHLESVLQR